MRKTWLSVVTALVLIVLSGGLILARRYVLGAEIDGTPGASAWRVSVEADGQLTAPDGTVALVLPPDFRRQHIADETYDSAELAVRLRRSREAGPRRALWERRPGVAAADAFHLRYSFRCVLGTRRPSAAMTYRSHTLDAAPADGALLRPSPRIESEADEVAHLAMSLVPESADAEDAVHLLYDHVAGLGHDEVPGPSSALSCLRAGRGDAAGKARLLVALCRQRRIPARLVTGLVLDDGDDGERPLHYWAEAWVDNRWLPMCPTYGRFGARRIPDTYLILSLGDNDLVQGKNARARPRWRATRLHDSFEAALPAVPVWVRSAWRRLTLGNLRPEDQEWVKFLLLIPVGALVVSFYRTVVGITTFGTFGPALLGLVCRDLKVMPWALSTFVGIMLVGWVVRRQLDRYHLLLAPRVAALLTVVVIGLMFGVLAAGSVGLVMGSYVALLPLIIMTHMIERFWTVEAEDGTAASFKTLVGTVVVAVTVALVINIDVFINGTARLFRHGPLVTPGLVRTTLFRYPEVLGFLLAAQFLLGRYTGYRLTELFRFRDLLIEEDARTASGAVRGAVPTGGRDGLAGTLPAPAGDGHSRDEPAEHRVHSGPEPAGPVSPGG
jgi:transglutaminase-like putative cysteine protease